MSKSLSVLFLVSIILGVVAWAAFGGIKSRKIEPVMVLSPNLEKPITSPVTIKGEALGTWFFEASFPVYLVNWDGLIIGEGIAQAKDDWMTEDYVPFEVTIDFETPNYGDNGALIFKKDNPSGLPEHDDAVEIPIRFK